MSRLVEDLLATARREADAMADTDLDLTTVAREAGVPQKPIHLRYASTGPEPLIGDADALRRAAGNLLSNAARLAPADSTVTLATGRTGSWLWLAVTDEGPGIPASDLPQVFDRFWRADHRRTGLGLAIVRQIVESHGGQVAAFSEPARGSAFVRWLPAVDRKRDAPPPRRAIRGRSRLELELADLGGRAERVWH